MKTKDHPAKTAKLEHTLIKINNCPVKSVKAEDITMVLEVSQYYFVKTVPLEHTTNKLVKLNARTTAMLDLTLIPTKLHVMNVQKDFTKTKTNNQHAKVV
jgi:hypothetical protein